MTDKQNYYLVAGIGIGLALGAAIGAIFDNIAIGAGLGILLITSYRFLLHTGSLLLPHTFDISDFSPNKCTQVFPGSIVHTSQK